MRKCPKCLENKHIDCFYTTGNHRRCKTCVNIDNKEYRDNNPEKVRNLYKYWRNNNKEKFKDYHKRWRLANSDKVHSYRLKSKYGISKMDYNNLITIQDNKCAICEEIFISTPHIDHCHKTGKIRGLLCGTCNRSLGLLKDNSRVVENMLKYLDKVTI